MSIRPFTRRTRAALVAVALVLVAAPVVAGDPTPLPGMRVLPTKMGFDALAKRLADAIGENRMGVVARASASAGAAARGIKIPGNMVVMVFRNDFAVRMLAASVPAGIEAPLRFYLAENADGTATLSYPLPSSVFTPYDNKALNEMAVELDTIFARIADRAVAAR
ncbi:MAG: DUF302 domain-containing protein [Alphaproteobacteria bacterium]